MSEDNRTVRLIIEGRVQGVGFRYFVAGEAQRRAIGGWARNLRDGRVEVLAQGDPDAVAALCEACGRGPHGAQVARLDVRDVPAETDYRAFEIRRDG